MWVQAIFILSVSQVFFSSLVILVPVLWVFRKLPLLSMSSRLFPTSSSVRVSVSAFMSMSLTRLELSFMQGIYESIHR